MVKLTGPHAWAAAAAVGWPFLAMYVTERFHPPAGIISAAGGFHQSALVVFDRARPPRAQCC